MSTPAIAPTCDLNSQLVAFLNDTPGAREVFTAAVLPRLRSMAAKMTLGWSADLREEVVQQVFLALLANRSRFAPARGTAASFLFQLTREAVRSVGAAYAPPGTLKRSGRTGTPIPVALDDLTEKGWQKASLARNGTPEAVEARCDVMRLARNMPPSLALVFARIADGETKTAIATEIDLNRFKLDRRIARFAREMRLAA